MAKSLGASLYVPANHKDLAEIANGDLIPQARSLIFCTEDAIADRELSYSLFNLSVVLANMRVDVAADRFFAGVAEHTLRGRIPGLDDPVQRLADDRVIG